MGQYRPLVATVFLTAAAMLGLSWMLPSSREGRRRRLTLPQLHGRESSCTCCSDSQALLGEWERADAALVPEGSTPAPCTLELDDLQDRGVTSKTEGYLLQGAGFEARLVSKGDRLRSCSVPNLMSMVLRRYPLATDVDSVRACELEAALLHLAQHLTHMTERPSSLLLHRASDGGLFGAGDCEHVLSTFAESHPLVAIAVPARSPDDTAAHGPPNVWRSRRWEAGPAALHAEPLDFDLQLVHGMQVGGGGGSWRAWQRSGGNGSDAAAP